MYCTACGAQLGDGDRFCGRCGIRVEAPAPPVPQLPDIDVFADASALVAEAREQERGGETGKAAAIYERTLTALGAASEHPAAGTACVRLGMLRASEEKPGEAEPLLARGLAILALQAGADERALALEAFAGLVEIYLVTNNRAAVEGLGRRYPELLAAYADGTAQQ